MVDINVGQIAEALNEKMDRNLANTDAIGQAILDGKVEVEALLEQNGYAKFTWKNGNKISILLFQWGIQINTQYGTYDKYFPTNFSNTKYIVMVTDWALPNISPFAKSIAVDYSNLTTSRFVAHFQDHIARGFAYIAVGS